MSKALVDEEAVADGLGDGAGVEDAVASVSAAPQRSNRSMMPYNA